jgi:hypothetical protein
MDYTMQAAAHKAAKVYAERKLRTGFDIVRSSTNEPGGTVQGGPCAHPQVLDWLWCPCVDGNGSNLYRSNQNDLQSTSRILVARLSTSAFTAYQSRRNE